MKLVDKSKSAEIASKSPEFFLRSVDRATSSEKGSTVAAETLGKPQHSREIDEKLPEYQPSRGVEGFSSPAHDANPTEKGPSEDYHHRKEAIVKNVESAPVPDKPHASAVLSGNGNIPFSPKRHRPTTDDDTDSNRDSPQRSRHREKHVSEGGARRPKIPIVRPGSHDTVIGVESASIALDSDEQGFSGGEVRTRDGTACTGRGKRTAAATRSPAVGRAYADDERLPFIDYVEEEERGKGGNVSRRVCLS